MANAFTQTYSRRFAGTNGKSLALVKGTLVIDTTASGGGAVDDLPASMFGLQKIIACLGIVPDSEDAIIVAGPDYTGDSLLVKAAATNALADLANDTYGITLIGQA